MSATLTNMFGLHLQNQVLLPLSHIASVLTGNYSVSKSKKQMRNSKKLCDKMMSQEIDKLYSESFILACKSISNIFSDKVYYKDILQHLNAFNNLHICHQQRRLQWLKSYSSNWSFDDNKADFCCSKTSILRRNVHSQNIQNHFIRSFNTKTKTSEFVGLGQENKIRMKKSEPSFSLQLNPELLSNVFKKSKKDKLESEKLKNLLNEENISHEEKQKIKVAFAEGYLAAEPKAKMSSKMKLFNIFRDLLGIVLILAILFSFMGGSFRRVLIGSTNEVHPEEIDVTFEDVKGVDEAKQELQEIVEFLKNPEKFSALGGKLPKGVLLVGPPGTGKTLLARAVAGEAAVPFFHAAGPEFDEILVGQGARRVRDLFSTAKLRAPCVVFIDEIDSVGAKRTNSVLHPYANQTINQLLTEMDGFRQNEGVIVLGATNRRDDLDRALLRPGRFDVEVQVPVPDFNGRKEILSLYLGKVKTSNDVDVDMLARGTTGFTGADLENMVNQAALRAAIDGAQSVTMRYLENSRDKVLMGPERKSRIPDEEANVITAYHEGGHALVANYTKDAHPLHKVTIIPRGPSLGHTAYIPEKEHYHVTKSQMLATLDTLMGGRAAEELVFGLDKITTGASSDLKKATSLATNMVKEWGMSEKIGVRTFEDEHNSLVVVNELAQSTAENIDSEIKKILQESYERAKNILKVHSREHKLIAEALLKYETLDAQAVKEILSRNNPKIDNLTKK